MTVSGHSSDPPKGHTTRTAYRALLGRLRNPFRTQIFCATAWTASRSVNRANRCGNPSFQFFAILVGVTGVSSEARWHELRGRGVAMCKMQAHLSARRHRVRTDHGLPRGRERGRVGACRSPQLGRQLSGEGVHPLAPGRATAG
eukprot:COSAG02_NODE_9_length_59728_cov_36.104714_64_plen_144_part_00